MTNLPGVVQQLRKERDQAAKAIERLDAALAALDGGSPRKSTATRWAKSRAKVGQTAQKSNVVSMPAKKKTISAAGRRKIAAAQRARWAKIRAAQKQKRTA